jgi:hypothetical protein
MKILVCGDRNWWNEEVVKEVLSQYQPDTVVIQGEARGADSAGKKAAEELGMTVIGFPAKWDELGRRAGIVRNLQMLDTNPDLVIAFHNFLPNSKGTKHTVTEALNRGIKVDLCNEKGIIIHLKKEDTNGQI